MHDMNGTNVGTCIMHNSSLNEQLFPSLPAYISLILLSYQIYYSMPALSGEKPPQMNMQHVLHNNFLVWSESNGHTKLGALELLVSYMVEKKL